MTNSTRNTNRKEKENQDATQNILRGQNPRCPAEPPQWALIVSMPIPESLMNPLHSMVHNGDPLKLSINLENILLPFFFILPSSIDGSLWKDNKKRAGSIVLEHGTEGRAPRNIC
ncbi:hypothetical protein CEXT_602231 [Caerostris extrusa]|uniref:Uncharacterized protein n=1 Tax=Caerostris extrusa TaxID=172846 RepID=A0AAV4MUK6_CAEEX|nr:hypothetical protein CEXT_602231 [Caerostris extrusa]